jgi:hypothetical protein
VVKKHWIPDPDPQHCVILMHICNYWPPCTSPGLSLIAGPDPVFDFNADQDVDPNPVFHFDPDPNLAS